MLRRDNNIVIKYNQKTVIGLTEPAVVIGPKGDKKEVVARIDTGATKSSIDVKLAADLSLGPIIKAKLIRSASGAGLRAVVNAKIILADKELKTEFTLADRSHMKYAVLIGQNILKEGFLIDPAKEAEGFYSEDDE
ncbi:RimK/LysX family protein [Thermoproteota archaeon]